MKMEKFPRVWIFGYIYIYISSQSVVDNVGLGLPRFDHQKFIAEGVTFTVESFLM